MSQLDRVLAGLVDAGWYRTRYPDTAGLDPAEHFAHFGLAEGRDPNRFFDGAFYANEYPQAAASGTPPLLHYLFVGAAEHLDPHPRFDAAWYVSQHPEAAANPLLFHLRTGERYGFPTCPQLDVRDFQPSSHAPLAPPTGVTADVLILQDGNPAQARRCADLVLARSGPRLGQVVLLRAARRAVTTEAVNRAIGPGRGRSGEHDVVLLDAGAEVPEGWLERLMAHAYAAPRIASISPLLCRTLPTGTSPAGADAVCGQVNAGRFAATPATSAACVYLRREALHAVGSLDADAFRTVPDAGIDFCLRAAAKGWSHRLACDVLVHHARTADEPAAGRDRHPAYGRILARDRRRSPATPYRFALTRALHLPGAPTILMLSHGLGGGVRRHIVDLAERLHGRANILLLESTEHHNTLSVPAQPDHPALVLPSDAEDDLAAVLQVLGVTRLHLHHTLASGLDARRLIRRLALPFDVTVHDYYAICPQRNLLPWEEGIHCGEPGPARCNGCIADANDVEHGARDILSWRLEHAWQLQEAERVICPSGDVQRRLARYNLAGRAVVAPHEPAADGVWPLSIPRLDGPVLRIAVLGVLANLKGARAVAAVAGSPDLAIHLIGRTEADFPAAAGTLITQTGPYREAELPALIRRIDPHVVWFASTAPETYSYTLSSAIETGLPIVATDLGAFPERLAGRPLTWLAPADASPADLLMIFGQVRETLASPPRPAAVPRPAAADFYARDYLAPARARAAPTRRRILALPAREPDGGVAPMGYARLLQPLDHPAIGGDHRLILASAADFERQTADLMIVQSPAAPDLATAEALIAHARRSGSALVLDLHTDPGADPAARALLAAADAVWAADAELADRTGGVFLETRLDERIWLPPAAPPGRWEEPIRILCLLDPGQAADFALIAPALERLKRAHGDSVEIEVAGLADLPPGMRHLQPPAVARRSAPAFTHWLRSAQPGWHLGLAPLLGPRAGGSVRVLEYAALGMPVLASDVATYRGSVADGAAGELVANTPAAWLAALDWMIRDEAHRHALAAQARGAFEQHGTLGAAAPAWRAALGAASRPRVRRRPAVTL